MIWILLILLLLLIKLPFDLGPSHHVLLPSLRVVILKSILRFTIFIEFLLPSSVILLVRKIIILFSQLFLYHINFLPFLLKIIIFLSVHILSSCPFISHGWWMKIIKLFSSETIAFFTWLVVFLIRIIIVHTLDLFELLRPRPVWLQSRSHLKTFCLFCPHTITDPISYVFLVFFYLLGVLFKSLKFPTIFPFKWLLFLMLIRWSTETGYSFVSVVAAAERK